MKLYMGDYIKYSLSHTNVIGKVIKIYTVNNEYLYTIKKLSQDVNKSKYIFHEYFYLTKFDLNKVKKIINNDELLIELI